MPPAETTRIVLASRPDGAAGPQHFRLERAPLPEPGEGQVRIRIVYLSLDPYMRGRMNAGPSYAPPVEVGAVMVGETVGVVEASRAPEVPPGSVVAAPGGWQTYAVVDAARVRRLDPDAAPPSTALGVLGMPGLTAYVGLLDLAEPREGETVVVSAAAGAVGSVVGQLARIRGCRAVGVAGGPRKVAYLRDTLGFDAAVDRHDPAFAEALAEACPDGIDVYFENVGGAVLRAVLPLLNVGARVPVCGQVAHYDGAAGAGGADALPRAMGIILTRRVTVRGFLVGDHLDRREAFLRDATSWLAEGRLRYRETVAEGIERAPEAFLAMLRGDKLGKQLVRVSPEP